MLGKVKAYGSTKYRNEDGKWKASLRGKAVNGAGGGEEMRNDLRKGDLQSTWKRSAPASCAAALVACHCLW